MDKAAFKGRTKQFALQTVALVDALPRGRSSDAMGKQLLRSATSVASNHRAACRAKSAADFISKMGAVEEEADESLFWLEMLVESGLVRSEVARPLMAEADELIAMTVASINTARRGK